MTPQLTTGSGGCGKTNVIKAVDNFFYRWGKRDSIVITALTGCAAALLPEASTLHMSLRCVL